MIIFILLLLILIPTSFIQCCLTNANKTIIDRIKQQEIPTIYLNEIKCIIYEMEAIRAI